MEKSEIGPDLTSYRRPGLTQRFRQLERASLILLDKLQDNVFFWLHQRTEVTGQTANLNYREEQDWALDHLEKMLLEPARHRQAPDPGWCLGGGGNRLRHRRGDPDGSGIMQVVQQAVRGEVPWRPWWRAGPGESEEMTWMGQWSAVANGGQERVGKCPRGAGTAYLSQYHFHFPVPLLMALKCQDNKVPLWSAEQFR